MEKKKYLVKKDYVLANQRTTVRGEILQGDKIA